NGNYNFTGLVNGAYTVTASLSGYTFNSTVTVLFEANSASINFTATATSNPIYNISGSVSANGTALNGVTMTMKGTNTTSTMVDTNGNYSFSGLDNGSYTVTPTLAGYTFSPASLSITINGANTASNNFTA